MGRDLIIKVIGDSKGLDPTIKKLALMGEIDKKNAETFEKNQVKYRSLVSQQVGTLEKLRIKQQKIIDLREKSTNPARIKRYNAMLKQTSTEINKVTGATTKQVSQMNLLQSSIASIGATMLAAFSVQQIIAFAGELQRLSIQLEADAKKNAIVFGESLGFVTEKAKENANAIGLTTNEYIRASASTQDLLVPLGFVRDEAAKMSTDLTELSGALSVWSGGTRSATEVSEILTKTILGETEQIKTLGIKIDQTSPSFNKRIKETMDATGQSLEQVKALEILNQIMSKSTDAQESFASGEKTMAQQVAESNAALREQEEIIAVKMMPVWKLWNKVVLNFAEETGREITKWSFVFGTIGKAFESLTTTTEAGTITNENYRKSIKDINKEWDDLMGISTTEVIPTVEKTIETLGGLNNNLTKLRTELMGVGTDSKEFARLNAEIKKTENRIKFLTGEQAVKQSETLLAKLTREAAELKKQLSEQSISGKIAEDTLMQYTITIEALTKAQDRLNKAIQKGKDEQNSYLETIDADDLVPIDAIDDGVIIWEGFQKKLTDVQKEQKDIRVATFEDELSHFASTVDFYVGKMASVFGAFADFRMANIENVERALDKETDVNKKRITDENNTIINEINRLEAHKQLTKDEADQKRLLADVKRADEEKLQREREETQRIALEEKKKEEMRKIAIVEKNFKMFSIITSTAQAVATALASAPPPLNFGLATAVGILGAAELSLVASTPLPEFAKGTKGKKGDGMARVGEEGEEIVFLPNGAKVLPHKQTKQHGDIIDAMYDNRLEAHIMKNYVPRLMPKQQTQGAKDSSFIDKMINGLGVNDFNTDPVVNALKKMDKNENERMQVLAGVIMKGMNKRPNLRN